MHQLIELHIRSHWIFTRYDSYRTSHSVWVTQFESQTFGSKNRLTANRVAQTDSHCWILRVTRKLAKNKKFKLVVSNFLSFSLYKNTRFLSGELLGVCSKCLFLHASKTVGFQGLTCILNYFHIHCFAFKRSSVRAFRGISNQPLQSIRFD